MSEASCRPRFSEPLCFLQMPRARAPRPRWSLMYWCLCSPLRFCDLCSGVLAYESHRRDEWSAWTMGLTIMAVVFNLLVPIHLNRAIWAVLNVVAGLFLVAHLGQRARSA